MANWTYITKEGKVLSGHLPVVQERIDIFSIVMQNIVSAVEQIGKRMVLWIKL